MRLGKEVLGEVEFIWFPLLNIAIFLKPNSLQNDNKQVKILFFVQLFFVYFQVRTFHLNHLRLVQKGFPISQVFVHLKLNRQFHEAQVNHSFCAFNITKI